MLDDDIAFSLKDELIANWLSMITKIQSSDIVQFRLTILMNHSLLYVKLQSLMQLWYVTVIINWKWRIIEN